MIFSGKEFSDEVGNIRPMFLQVTAIKNDPLLDDVYNKMTENGYRVVYQIKKAPDGKDFLDGLLSVFTKNEKLVCLASYRDGLPDGVEVLWNESGQIISQTTFSKGKKIGNVLMWSNQGVLVARETYKFGKRVGEHLYWGEDGEIRRVAYWNNDDLEKIALYGSRDGPKVLYGLDAKKYLIEAFRIRTE